MTKIERISAPMSLTEIAVRASYQIVVLDKQNEPVSIGSGCIVRYKDRLFFLTVAHVTDEENVAVTIETNEAPINGQTPNFKVGDMNYYDLLEIKDLEKVKKEKEIQESDLKRLSEKQGTNAKKYNLYL